MPSVDYRPPPDSDEAPAPVPARSRWLRAGTVLSLGWIALVVLAALFSGVLPLADPHRYAYGPTSHGPSWHDWFGTNTGGQDLFSQVVHGARVSIIVGVVSVAAGLLVGGSAGIAAGYLRGPVDAAVVWVSDVLLTFPGLVFALALVAFLGSSLTNVVLAISIFGLPVYARVTRGVTISLSQREYVQAAEALGATRLQILRREILPNVGIPLLAYSALGASVAIIAEGGLAFLGVSAPGNFSWGFLIAQGQQELYQAPQALLAPMAVMFLTILALNVVGDHLGASLDPRASNL